MKKLLFLLIPVVFLSGCVMERMAKSPRFAAKVCAACAGRDTFIIKDTDSIYITQRDTLIQTERDTATMYVQLGCDSLGNVYIKDIRSKQGRITYLSTLLTSNQLTIEALKGQETALVTRVQDLQRRLTKVLESHKSEIEVPVPYIPWWVYLLIPFAVIGAIQSIRLFIKYVLPIIRKALIGV